MENASPVPSNSFILEGRTPIKRLGLSRKRKSLSDTGTPGPKIIKTAKCHEDSSPVSSHHSRLKDLNSECSNVTTDEEKSGNKNFNENLVITSASAENEEIQLVQKRINEKLKTLSDLKNKNYKILELKSLIELWKSGCKNAYWHLNHLLQERQKENLRPKTWLKSLGVWKVMVDTFQDDSEISLSEDSE